MKIINNIITTTLLLLCCATLSFAAESTHLVPEIISAINTARTTPENKTSPPLATLALNGNLTLVAEAISHGNNKAALPELLARRGFFAHSSDMVQNTIYFSNFHIPTNMVAILLSDLIANERSISQSARRAILNPDFTDLGCALQPVTRRVGRKMYNGYQLTIVMAENAVSANDSGLLQLINQARNNPLSVVEELGLDKTKILKEFAGDRRILTEGLPPITFNGDILASTNMNSRENLQGGLAAPASSLSSKDISALLAKEKYHTNLKATTPACDLFTSVTGPTGLIDSDWFISMLFTSTFKNELKADGIGYCLLQDDILEAGVTILNGQTFESVGDINPAWTTMQIMAFFAVPKTNPGPVFSGVIYRDANENHLYDIGEGVPGVLLTISGKDIRNKIHNIQQYSDAAGGFSVPLSAGRYSVKVVDNGGIFYQNLLVKRQSVYRSFSVGRLHR